LIPSNERTNTSEAATRPLLAIEVERETPKKSASFVLTLILLGIIGYAGYRVWPPVLDIWQRMHQPAEAPETPVKASPVAPAAISGAPETKSDDSSPAAPLVQKTAPAAAEDNPAPTQASDPKAPAKLAESAAAVAAVEKATSPQKPAAPFEASAANSLKSTLGSQLADISLASKVKMQVTGNTLTLSGQITSREHGKVLTLLHDVPGGVRVIDDIGYADELKETPAAAESGWVWIRSMPMGAKIFVDGRDTGLHTPARVEMSQGQHEVLLSLGGFVSSHRSVLIRPGQNMQFTEPLGQP
jgi:hypothetical protein